MSAPVRLPSRAGKALFIDHVAPHTRLLEKRRQMFEVEEALKAQKQEYARREDAFRQREEGLRKKDLDLQEALIRFNQILTENEAKKVRAEKRAGDEMRQTLGKEDEIGEATRTLESLRLEASDLTSAKARLEPYTRFMELFQRSHAQEYAETGSIMERHATLRDAQRDLRNEQQEIAHRVEDERRALARVRKAASTQVLTSENLVTKMKERLEEARARVARLQAGADESALSVGEKALELGQILQSVLNLHTRCTTSEHGRVIRHTPADGDIPGMPSAAVGAGAAAGEGDDAEEDEPEGVDAPAVDEASVASPGSPGPGADGAASTASPAATVITGVDAEALASDAEALAGKVAEATALLRVVGKYVNDFEAIVREYSAWTHEQRRRQADKEVTAAAEAGRLAAARMARMASRPSTRGSAGASSPLRAAAPAVDVSGTPGASGGATGLSLTASSSSASLNASSSAAALASARSGGALTSGRRNVLGSARVAGGAFAAASSAGLAASGVPQGPIISRGGAKVYTVKGAVIPPHVIANITGRQVGLPAYAQSRPLGVTAVGSSDGVNLRSSNLGMRASTIGRR